MHILAVQTRNWQTIDNEGNSVIGDVMMAVHRKAKFDDHICDARADPMLKAVTRNKRKSWHGRAAKNRDKAGSNCPGKTH
jgi:hypothetical protein